MSWFQVCNRCQVDSDVSSIALRLVTSCGVLGPTWLCVNCERAHTAKCKACRAVPRKKAS